MDWVSFIVLVGVGVFFYFVITGKLYVSPKTKRKPSRDNGVLNIPLNAKVIITYEDTEKTISERQISAITYDGYKYLNAFCHLRNGPRTFKIDQIVNCTSTITGEVIEDIEAYFNEKYADAAKNS